MPGFLSKLSESAWNKWIAPNALIPMNWDAISHLLRSGFLEFDEDLFIWASS
ncbi:hypothetical protein [Metabacillus sp. Hm71]|uniref:hypothetical protein n=1 Tax=Metabacillus sp. Hm71 TaxID=3450743 RepID=UPI003F425780